MNKTDKLSKRLQELSNHLQETDRLQAALDMPCSYETIKRYLTGKVGKEAFAKKLINYFEERLQEAA